jgi:hypothetical protein
MRNAKPARAERNLGKQNWAERDKVWIEVKPNLTRCEKLVRVEHYLEDVGRDQREAPSLARPGLD